MPRAYLCEPPNLESMSREELILTCRRLVETANKLAAMQYESIEENQKHLREIREMLKRKGLI